MKLPVTLETPVKCGRCRILLHEQKGTEQNRVLFHPFNTCGGAGKTYNLPLLILEENRG